MDEEEREEILIRLDERTKKVDDTIERLEQRTRENSEAIETNAEQIQANSDQLKAGKGIIGFIGMILSGLAAKVVGILHL